MTIDVFSDDLIEVRTLAKSLMGSDIAPRVIYRWISKGANGAQLDGIKLGRKWYTTEAEFRRFVDNQTQSALNKPKADTNRHDDSYPPDVSKEELNACGLL